jgi:hypothetical protein
MPLQELFAVLQALVPLHELIPLQWTDLLIFLASAGVGAAPLRTRAIAAAAIEAPETILAFISISLKISSQDERSRFLGNLPTLFVAATNKVTAVSPRGTGAVPDFFFCGRGATRATARRLVLANAKVDLLSAY